MHSQKNRTLCEEKMSIKMYQDRIKTGIWVEDVKSFTIKILHLGWVDNLKLTGMVENKVSDMNTLVDS